MVLRGGKTLAGEKWKETKGTPKSDEIHNMLVTDELKQPRICGRCKVEGGNGGNSL